MSVTVPSIVVPAVIIRQPAPAATGLGEETVSRTLGITLDDTLASAQAKIDSIGRLIPYGVTITVQFDNGAFSYAGNLDFAGFYGMGTLKVCSKGTTFVKHLTQPATLTITSGYLRFINVHCDVFLQNMHIIGGVTLDGIRLAFIRYCYFDGAASTILTASRGGYALLSENYMTNTGILASVIAEYGARVDLATSEGTGTAPTIGALARYGGVITLYDLLLSGSISSETGGMFIRSNGTIV